MSKRLIELGEFEFDADSGELRRTDGAGEPTRLAPQPARLLGSLIDRRGELLTRQEIRETLWPGVNVDFDRALNFCVRQLRAALGDSATEPRYIETLPRRGYRLRVVPVEVDREEADDQETGLGAKPKSTRAFLTVLIAVLGALAVTLWLAASREPQPRLRLAIMPFEPPPELSTAAETGQIADHLLLRLGKDERFEVIGPTTTEAFGSGAAAIRRLVADHAVDYLINGRFLAAAGAADGAAGEPQMLAELIRADDGAHVWVERFEDLRQPREMAQTIGDQVLRWLGDASANSGPPR